ncbi:hypothetical protein BpHYR1_044516 [Brachionus plicatilis]|uniref:Uncharacterized protein n=1 Tax=Brachionus plicatilis TaxID=10195 RepID=A0A3M7SYT1_BRAPC|nr:hypothetical protein BpHYR1_044516 [Brachionus plicatilis]
MNNKINNFGLTKSISLFIEPKFLSKRTHLLSKLCAYSKVVKKFFFRTIRMSINFLQCYYMLIHFKTNICKTSIHASCSDMSPKNSTLQILGKKRNFPLNDMAIKH